METKLFKLANYQKPREDKNRQSIRSSLDHLKNGNLSVKSAMADELQKMGIPASAISRLLNITYHRRIKL